MAIPPAGSLSWSWPSPQTSTSINATTEAFPDSPVFTAPAVLGSTAEPDASCSPTRIEGLGVASLDAIISSLPSLHDLAVIDWSVFEAVQRSAGSIGLSSWSDLQEYINKHFFDVGEPNGFLIHLAGHVGEVKAADFFISNEHVVEWPDHPNNPGFDLLVDGEPVQVKAGSPELLTEHLHRYPDIPHVITGTDNIGHVPDGLDPLFLDSLNSDQLHHTTAEALDIGHNDFHAGGPTIPVITVIRSSLKEIGLLADGHTDLTTAAKHVGLDAAGTAGGSWLGAQAGASVGSALGPVGMAVGTVVGAVLGAMFGRGVTNEIKYGAFNDARSRYLCSVSQAQDNVRTYETAAHQKLSSLVAKEQASLSSYVSKMQTTLAQRLFECSRWYDTWCDRFVKAFASVLGRVETMLCSIEVATLAAMPRPSMLRRVLWPAMEDVRYAIVQRDFGLRRKIVVQAHQEFSQLAMTSTGRVGVGKIESFLKAHPFADHEFELACQKLSQAYSKVIRKSKELKQQAEGLCHLRHGKTITEIRMAVEAAGQEAAAFVQEQARTVDEAKQTLLREGRKIGIDLKAEQGEA